MAVGLRRAAGLRAVEEVAGSRSSTLLAGTGRGGGRGELEPGEELLDEAAHVGRWVVGEAQVPSLAGEVVVGHLEEAGRGHCRQVIYQRCMREITPARVTKALQGVLS